ncbi:MAG: dUTP diphosphatase [Acetanaerobacterium sp.]
MKLLVKKLHQDAVIPRRATEGSAGHDLYALLTEPVTVRPSELVRIPTGLAIALPGPDYGAFVYARSGLAIKFGIAPSNCVGVIDSDYRGELVVGLTNHSCEPYTIQNGERIAQLIIAPVILPEIEECDTLGDTARGAGGFGSTGR